MSHCPTRQQIFKFIVRSCLPLLFLITESLKAWRSWGRWTLAVHVQGSSTTTARKWNFLPHSRFYSSLFTRAARESPGAEPPARPALGLRLRLLPPVTHPGRRGERRIPAAWGAPARPVWTSPKLRPSPCGPAAPPGQRRPRRGQPWGAIPPLPPLSRGDPRPLPLTWGAAGGEQPSRPPSSAGSRRRPLCSARPSPASMVRHLRLLLPRRGPRPAASASGRAAPLPRWAWASPRAGRAVWAPSLSPFPPAGGAGPGCAAPSGPRLGRAPAAADAPLPGREPTHRPSVTGAGSPPPRRSSCNWNRISIKKNTKIAINDCLTRSPGSSVAEYCLFYEERDYRCSWVSVK